MKIKSDKFLLTPPATEGLSTIPTTEEARSTLTEISYEDFVISILGVMTGSGFGRGGKKKKTRNNKNKIINKKTKKQLVKKVKENSKIKKHRKIFLLESKKNNKKHNIRTIKKR